MRKLIMTLVAAGAVGAPAFAQEPARTQTQAWIGIAFSCSNCTYQQDGGGRWTFSAPPEVYSVEPGSPAYGAGIRRGDVLTHVDGMSITSEPGGQRWARVQPGDEVRLRYVRNGAVMPEATFRASERPATATLRLQRSAEEMRALEATLARRDSTVRSGLRTQEQELAATYNRLTLAQRNQLATQEERVRELRRYLRGLTPAETRRVDELLSALVREQRTLNALQSRELEQTLLSSRALTERLTLRDSLTARFALRDSAALTSTRAALLADRARARSGGLTTTEPRLRYSGTLGTTDVEVRGVSPVTVEETTDEVVIRVGDTVVRLRRSR